MRKYKLQFALLAVVALFTISSCQKEGSEGPEGPAGPAGPQGPAGVANVIYSDWLDVVYDEYFSPEPGDTTYYATIPAPKLTADIKDKGEVKVYVNINTVSEPNIAALPFFSPDGILIGYTFDVGTITLFSNLPLSTAENGGDPAIQYRYVLIPGGVLAVKPADVKLDSYKDVQKYFKIN